MVKSERYSELTSTKMAIEAIVMGTSAGGIGALLNILPKLPPGYGLPIIVLVHMPDMFDSKLADIFQIHMKIPVCQAQDKELIKPGQVYFAPPGYHLSIETDRSFSLSCEEPVHFSRPSIDLLMISAADSYGKNLAGILLTGASHDGAQGMACIKKAGGLTVVQDPAEAESNIMPKAAIALAKPDLILTLGHIYQLLIDLETTDPETVRC